MSTSADPKTIEDAVNAALERDGITLTQLAVKVGLDESGIRRLRRQGAVNPRALTVKKLARGLKLSGRKVRELLRLQAHAAT